MSTEKFVLAVVVVALFSLGFGVAMGSSTSDGGWRRDCNSIGAHVMDGKVYDCKERK